MANAILFLFLASVIGHSVAHRYSVSAKEAEDYDAQFSKFLREVLENLRDQMGEGIPDIGIPPVDPFSMTNITEYIETGYVNMLLQLRDLNVTGVSKFKINFLKADLGKGFVNISISLPEVSMESYCDMDGKILCIFPLNSKGPFHVRISEVNIDGYGLLNITSGDQTRIHMNDLRLTLTFGSLGVDFKGLLDGAHWVQVLLDVVTPTIFTYFNEPIMDAVNQALLTLANNELNKGALNDYLDLIQKTY